MSNRRHIAEVVSDWMVGLTGWGAIIGLLGAFGVFAATRAPEPEWCWAAFETGSDIPAWCPRIDEVTGEYVESDMQMMANSR